MHTLPISRYWIHEIYAHYNVSKTSTYHIASYAVHLEVILNLMVWQIWLQSPNFMSANTNHSQTIPFY